MQARKTLRFRCKPLVGGWERGGERRISSPSFCLPCPLSCARHTILLFNGWTNFLFLPILLCVLRSSPCRHAARWRSLILRCWRQNLLHCRRPFSPRTVIGRSSPRSRCAPAYGQRPCTPATILVARSVLRQRQGIPWFEMNARWMNLERPV